MATLLSGRQPAHGAQTRRRCETRSHTLAGGDGLVRRPAGRDQRGMSVVHAGAERVGCKVGPRAARALCRLGQAIGLCRGSVGARQSVSGKWPGTFPLLTHTHTCVRTIVPARSSDYSCEPPYAVRDASPLRAHGAATQQRTRAGTPACLPSAAPPAMLVHPRRVAHLFDDVVPRAGAAHRECQGGGGRQHRRRTAGGSRSRAGGPRRWAGASAHP